MARLGLTLPAVVFAAAVVAAAAAAAAAAAVAAPAAAAAAAAAATESTGNGAVPATTESVEDLWRKVRKDDKIEFHLYSRQQRSTYTRLESDSSSYDPHRPTVFMAHGYLGCGTTESVQMVRDAVLNAEDVQFVAVHWEFMAGASYIYAAKSTKVVAAKVAALLDVLISGLGARLQDFHLVGFSLGAQVMAQVGQTLKAGPVPRITALDPAAPLFRRLPPEEQLDPTDAELVVVLHTAGGFVSFTEPLGHIDFYPNDGVSPQPACVQELFAMCCSHSMAPKYLAEAVNRPDSFVGLLCSSWKDFVSGTCGDCEMIATLGLFNDYSSRTRGSFYLHTGAVSPYGLGDEGSRQGRPPFGAAPGLSSVGLAALLLCAVLTAY